LAANLLKLADQPLRDRIPCPLKGDPIFGEPLSDDGLQIFIGSVLFFMHENSSNEVVVSLDDCDIATTIEGTHYSECLLAGY
jgi:hypothetical protein